MPNKVWLYANVGPELTQYDVDVDAAALTRRETVSLPANVQYAWRMHRGSSFMSRPATARPAWGRRAATIT